MKTITFTDDEIQMIREDITDTREYTDQFIRRDYYSCNEDRERNIAQVRTAESILKKLGEVADDKA